MPSLPYILKSSVLLAVLLLYYGLFLRKQTFFTLNRMYLIGALLLSVTVPLFHFSIFIEEAYTAEELPVIYQVSGLMEEIRVSPDAGSFSGLAWIYLSGVCIFALRQLYETFAIFRLIFRYPCKRIQGLKIIYVPEKYPTFSFFNYLFLNTRSLSRESRRKIVEHEKIHICQGHSFDLWISTIICILCWYNPLVWMYRKIITQNHEYIADKQVIGKYQTGSYFQLLVNQAFRGDLFLSANCFSCSNLKKRMIMMTKKQSKKYHILNYIPALFLCGILCTAFTCITTQVSALPLLTSSPDIPQEEQPQRDTNIVFNVVEVMPKFNGNMNAWVIENIKYPQKAQEQKTEGKVFVKFVIEKDGSITNVAIARSVNELLDAEAVRVVKAMPAWSPGKQKGKPVRVAFTVPINFSLSSPPAINEKKIFQVVETMPKFDGNMNEWLKNNMKYPAEAQKAKQQGKAYVNFVVNEDGHLSDFRIQKSSGHPLLDEEALRVARQMPNWLPGKQRGKAVKVNYTLPFNFSLK